MTVKELVEKAIASGATLDTPVVFRYPDGLHRYESQTAVVGLDPTRVPLSDQPTQVLLIEITED
jgi:hypothetical protein